MPTLTRRRKIVPALAAAVLAVAITAGIAPASAQAKTIMPNGSGQPWRHPGQPSGVRAGELLAVLSPGGRWRRRRRIATAISAR
jgi:hypothetical protein